MPPDQGTAGLSDDIPDVLDGGLKDARKGPERTCIVTRAVLPTDKLIRFVRGPDGQVVPDLAQRLPGRGVWVSARQADVAQAADKKLFSRAFKAQSTTPPDFAAAVGQLLRARALQSLALANKAGALVAGFEKVESTIFGGRAEVLISASDGSQDGIGKLLGRSRAVHESGGPDTMHVTLFSCDELSLSAGRSRVIHAALEASGATSAFLRDFRRIEAYLTRNDLSDGTSPHRAAPRRGATPT